MIKNKKMLMALSFCVGAILLATTAFADILTKTGYDVLKDSMKYTAESLTEKSQSFTLQGTTSIKDNGSVILSSSGTTKTDNINKQTETTSIDENKDGQKRTSYSYSDENVIISHSSDNDVYYVTDFSSKNINFTRSISNPFKQSGAKDIEKIADALIGNLKDYIVVSEKADGSKELSSSLSEAQIPSLINAVASFGFKQKISQSDTYPSLKPFPEIVDDILIKNVKGNVIINKDGILESFLGSVTLTGKDKDGNQHDIILEVLLRISDLNSTIVSKPDLTGKKIDRSFRVKDENGKMPASFIGKYTNNIVIYKDDKFIKVGERFIEISEIKENHIIGKYYEEYKAEYVSQYPKNNYNFDAEIKGPYNGEFSSETSEGKKFVGNISWNMQAGNIYLFGNPQIVSYDGNFSRVFEK